ncbi:YycH family regulatory protein [Bacillus massiliigorillae]|uniref:YycH family regulatory protein n=1 Tax=Bacillus massiliigorillae TaxID=1243664 RepID=UPI0005AAA914|nr:two-component system activity regulator YycH [Bacillus massiliigorillae]
MNKELIKTILLTFLVCNSVFLTWSIVTYSPKIDLTTKEQVIPNVAISNKKAEKDIIRPSLIMVHEDDEYYGSIKDEDINMVLDEMDDWTFYNFKDVTNSITQKVQSFIDKKAMIELVFPDNVPFAIYKKVIKVEDRELRRDLEFDRILISAATGNGEENEVYFVSTDPEKKYVYRFDVSASHLKKLTNQIREKAKKFDHYTVINATPNKALYVPENKGQYPKYKYTTKLLDVNKFKNALFPDPGVVKSDQIVRGQEFTGGSTFMRVFYDTMVLKYVNPGLKETYKTAKADLLENSIEFINEHSGWEDNYRFAEINQDEQKTTFRLYVNGLPTFNNQFMSELVQKWVEDDLKSYFRPFFTLELAILSESDMVTLPSGKEAFQQISSVAEPNYEADLLEDMQIGYRMVKDMEAFQYDNISLEPAWYYKYNGEWKSLTLKQTGGISRGLE